MLGRLRWDSVGGGGTRKGGVTIIKTHYMWMKCHSEIHYVWFKHQSHERAPQQCLRVPCISTCAHSPKVLPKEEARTSEHWRPLPPWQREADLPQG